jgi:hypothetical protein
MSRFSGQEFAFIQGGSHRDETCGADRIYAAIAIVPVGELRVGEHILLLWLLD